MRPTVCRVSANCIDLVPPAALGYHAPSTPPAALSYHARGTRRRVLLLHAAKLARLHWAHQLGHHARACCQTSTAPLRFIIG